MLTSYELHVYHESQHAKPHCSQNHRNKHGKSDGVETRSDTLADSLCQFRLARTEGAIHRYITLARATAAVAIAPRLTKIERS